MKTKKQKIIQVVAYYPPHLGGMEYFVKEISTRLAKKNYDVEVYTSENKEKDTDAKNIKNLTIHYLKKIEIAHTPIMPSLFFHLSKIPKDAIIHLHSAQAYVSEVVWIMASIRNIPYFVYCHVDLGSSGFFGFLLPFYKKLLFKRVLLGAKRIIVATKDYKEIIKKRYGIADELIDIIPSGVHLAAFRQNKTIKKEVKNLLFVGRLNRSKNLVVLLETLKLLRKKDHDLHLHIVGSGEDEEIIHRWLHKHSYHHAVTLHGGMAWKQVIKLYTKYDIFVIPSREESLGLVALEAMASGLPVVASNIPGLRSVINHNKTGLLAKPTPPHLAKAIVKLIRNYGLRKKMIINGLKDVKRYDWNIIIQQFEKVYKTSL